MESPPTARWYWLAAAALVFLHGTAAWLLRTPQVSPASNDEALYLLLARSLHSFRYLDSHVVGGSVHAFYPPGFPAILSVATAIFGNSLDVALAANILLSMLGLFLVFDLLRRITGPEVGLLALAALVLNTKLVDFASRLYSEPSYMGLSLAAIWTLSCVKSQGRRLAVAAALTILAALTRGIGLSLIAALILVWVVERRYRALGWYLLSVALTVGAWLTWTAMAPDKITERSYVAVATTVGKVPSGLVGVAIHRFLAFFKQYLGRSFSSALDVPTVQGVILDNLVWILLIGGLALAGVYALWKRPPPGSSGSMPWPTAGS